VKPTLDELTTAQQRRLAALTPETLTVTDVEPFEDDHCPCVEACVNGIWLSVWWLTPAGAGAFWYCGDSADARGVVLAIIREGLGL
jgi:hypothetical protein